MVMHLAAPSRLSDALAPTHRPQRPDGRRLIILQEPLDVIEFDLRALRIGKPAAEFFQNPAHPLHIDFAGDLDREIVAIFALIQRPPQGIVLIAAALLPAGAIAGSVALPLAFALLHGVGETLGALAQRFQRPALAIDGAFGVALPEPASGIAHRRIGVAKTVLAVALIALLTALALLALLSFLPALPF